GATAGAARGDRLMGGGAELTPMTVRPDGRFRGPSAVTATDVDGTAVPFGTASTPRGTPITVRMARARGPAPFRSLPTAHAELAPEGVATGDRSSKSGGRSSTMVFAAPRDFVTATSAPQVPQNRLPARKVAPHSPHVSIVTMGESTRRQRPFPNPRTSSIP